jgi:adenosylcobinamide-phosphate synthase
MRAGARGALALALGFGLDRALGDPRRWHPVAGFGRIAQALERASWRASRLAGALHVGVLLAAVGWLAARGGSRTPVAALVVWTALGGRSLERAAQRMQALLDADALARARAHAPVLVGRDPHRLDASELCRATIESLAENTADAVVGALLWGALAGARGAAVYRAANTLDAMIGHRSPRYERFGWAAARLDDLLTWPAARVTALLAVTLAPLAGGRAGAAMRVLRRDGHRHPSPNAGRAEAAFAGALGVRLGGVNRYPTHTEHRPELGDGDAPRTADIARAVRLSRLIGRAALLACCAAALARGR